MKINGASWMATAQKAVNNGGARVLLQLICIVFVAGMLYAKLTHIEENVKNLEDRTLRSFDKLEMRLTALEQKMVRP